MHAFVCMCLYLCEVVVNVECGQLGEVSIEAQGHKEACILIGQLRALWLVVGDPSWVHLHKEKEGCVYFYKNKDGWFTAEGW